MNLPGEAQAVDREDSTTFCSFQVGTGIFGIDTRRVREVLGRVSMQRVPRASEFIAGVLPYRGEVLATVGLRILLGLEDWPGTACVLVLEDEERCELFGLMVDRVHGVVSVDRHSLEPNPGGLDARSSALFDGVYKMPMGLMIRLDPRHLRPAQLLQRGLFVGSRGHSVYGEPALDTNTANRQGAEA